MDLTENMIEIAISQTNQNPPLAWGQLRTRRPY